MVEVWYWCSMVLLHSFEQFQYDYKLKKIFWKSWHHRATVAGKSLRQKIAITINFFYWLILTTRWGTIHTITQPGSIKSKKKDRI